MGLFPDPLHPAVVHFPIALTFVVLFLELLAIFPRCRSVAVASPLLLVLAAMGSVAAVASGHLAADAAVIPEGAGQIVERHEELGETVMVGLLVLAALRLLFFRLERFSSWVRVAFLGLLLLAAGAVGYNGKLGGELVFDHGVGTTSVMQGLSRGQGGQGNED